MTPRYLKFVTHSMLLYDDGVSWFGREAHGLGLVPGDPEAKPGAVVL